LFFKFCFSPDGSSIQRGKWDSFHFDSKYCLNRRNDEKAAFFEGLDRRDAAGFVEAFPVIRREMDSWFACHPKAERLFQHNLIKNNPGRLTILDIEYAGRTGAKRLFRLDMLGVYKAEDGWRLVVFENKFGGGARGLFGRGFGRRISTSFMDYISYKGHNHLQ